MWIVRRVFLGWIVWGFSVWCGWFVYLDGCGWFVAAVCVLGGCCCRVWFCDLLCFRLW